MHIPFGMIDFTGQTLAIKPEATPLNRLNAIIVTVMGLATGNTLWPFGAGDFEG
jgi:hypothetical protein